ncbi:N-formylglutamate amidohydrolase [Insolitispirillum peregrinum]|uniref:N-formylglutamate amidohydrolase n=1 Tax=Insolitispirillum peregrinum TaxID=80876 RepID=UPI003619A964
MTSSSAFAHVQRSRAVGGEAAALKGNHRDLAHRLLAADEPAACQVINPLGQAPLVLVCDHASNRVPHALNNLGLPMGELDRHIGYDIGIAEVTRHLAMALDCPAVLCNYSRLVVDCNRAPHDGTAMPETSDGTVIPANLGLTEIHRAARREAIFYPYHAAITDMVISSCERLQGRTPMIVAMHSFTPCLKDAGCDRPWHVGLLWNRDGRLFTALQSALQQQGWCVGDNQPYSGREIAHTLNTHAEPAGLAHVGVEIRQDLIGDTDGAKAWAAHFAQALGPLLGQKDLLRPVLADELLPE